jgi:TonB family protein
MRFLELVLAAALSQAPMTRSVPPPYNSVPPEASPLRTGDDARKGAECSRFYPLTAFRTGLQGTTDVDGEITPQGTVADAILTRTSGDSGLDNAAIACVKTWTYSPTTQNGTPVGARTTAHITWAIRGEGEPPPSHPVPPPGPPGWSEDWSSEFGVLANYKLVNSDDASNQFMSARFSGAYDQLNDLIAKGAHIVSEANITICNGEAARQLEYTRPSPVNSSRILDVDQVATLREGYIYVSEYIRPMDAAKRPEAEQWIRSYCDSEK